MRYYITLLLIVLYPIFGMGQDIETGTSVKQTDGKIALVLSGGGAKGLFHIGVIEALEENNIPIDYILGTSIGAIVGGLYSMGYTPLEMLDFFTSSNFNGVLTGKIPDKYKYYSLKMDPTASMVSLRFNMHKSKFKAYLPTNLVNPEMMDLEFISMTAPYSAISGRNFDSLMVPFRCVASDIKTHKPYIMKDGDLGTAIRASMAYPFVFKSVIIDSTLLFDGGFYNNFPWDIAIDHFKPDFIIGSRCASNVLPPEEDNIISQVTNMLMYETDYSIPDSLGYMIEMKFPDVELLDFHKAKELFDSGYHTTIKNIENIKAKIVRRVSENELQYKRESFKKRAPELIFSGARVMGLKESQNRNIERILTLNDSDEEYNFEVFRDRYFSVISNKLLTTFYPTVVCNPETGFFRPEMRAIAAPPYKVSIGGNLSSASGNIIYAEIEARRWEKTLTRARLNGYFGRFYSSGQFGFRQDYAKSVPFFFESYLTVSIYDYYKGSQNVFNENIKPVFLKDYDYNFSADIGMAVTKNSKIKIGGNVGYKKLNYYKTSAIKSNDTPDNTKLPFTSVHILVQKNTTDFNMFPTKGHSLKIVAKNYWGDETHHPGTTSTSQDITKRNHSWYTIRGVSDYYITIFKHFTLGIYAELVLSKKIQFEDYYSTLDMLPTLQPTPHSKTFFLENYRAHSYAAFGLTPSLKLNNTLYVRANAYVFQPYESLIMDENNKVKYSSVAPSPKYMASAAAVWQTPVGPISFAVNYYSHNYSKLYYSFNFGVLIFNKKGIEY